MSTISLLLYTLSVRYLFFISHQHSVVFVSYATRLQSPIIYPSRCSSPLGIITLTMLNKFNQKTYCHTTLSFSIQVRFFLILITDHFLLYHEIEKAHLPYVIYRILLCNPWKTVLVITKFLLLVLNKLLFRKVDLSSRTLNKTALKIIFLNIKSCVV